MLNFYKTDVYKTNVIRRVIHTLREFLREFLGNILISNITTIYSEIVILTNISDQITDDASPG